MNYVFPNCVLEYICIQTLHKIIVEELFIDILFFDFQTIAHTYIMKMSVDNPYIGAETK